MKSATKKISSLFFLALLLAGALVFPKSVAAIGIACQELKVNLNVNPNEVPVSDKVTRAETKEAKKKLKKQCIKEYFMDNIAWAAANIAIQSITSSIVDWVNSGFEGKPAFVQDLKGHFQDLSNAVFEDMLKIFDVEDFVCSSFSARLKNSFNIQLAIAQGGGRNAQEKQFMTQARCTVDDVLKNFNSSLEDFQNNFTDSGGWKAWLTVIQPQNNELGATLAFQQELWRRQSETKENDDKTLSWGHGFMSWPKQVCDPQDPSEAGPPNCHEEIQTPGKVIQDQLDQSLGGGQRRLEVADEINEVIGAVMSQLVQQVLQKGLAGASSSGNSGSSLTNDLRNEQPDLSDTREGLQGSIDNDMANLEQYIAIRQGSLATISTSISLFEQLRDCYASKGNTAAANQTTAAIQNLQTQKTAIQADIANAQEDRLTLETFRAQSETDGNNTQNVHDTTGAYANITSKYDPEDAAAEDATIQNEAQTRDAQTREDLLHCRLLP